VNIPGPPSIVIVGDPLAGKRPERVAAWVDGPV
jgi:hypothetical protein